MEIASAQPKDHTPKSGTKPSSLSPLSPEQVVARALNEQGFLFAQVVREKIQGTGGQTRWKVEASEYPVTASDGSQTRIDLVLSDGVIRLAVECKRANPLFKRWIFFDKANGSGVNDQSLLLETQFVSKRPVTSPLDVQYSIKQYSASFNCPIFNYYLEAALDRKQKVSATDTIEDAFHQVVKGHTGLMGKLIGFASKPLVRSIPVVVTTAELVHAVFDHNKISIHDGQVDASDISLETLQFCGVNYHADDALALKTESNSMSRTDIRNDLMHWQTRTVFVVQAQWINKFLGWAEHYLTNQG